MLRNLSNITPKTIETFLLETGWAKDIGFPSSKLMVFHPINAANFQIAVPATTDISDYWERVYDIIAALSTLTDCSPDEIIDALLTCNT